MAAGGYGNCFAAVDADAIEKPGHCSCRCQAYPLIGAIYGLIGFKHIQVCIQMYPAWQYLPFMQIFIESYL